MSTEPIAPRDQTSLSTAAARNLATTTKTPPQMQGISSRWLLRTLPWVDVKGGTYRINRRLKVRIGKGRVSFNQQGADNVRIIPQTLTELQPLRGYTDIEILTRIANLFTPRTVQPGEVIASQGEPITKVYIVAHGRLRREAPGKYGETEMLGLITDGDQIGHEALGQDDPAWSQTVISDTPGIIMELEWPSFQRLFDAVPSLQVHLNSYLERLKRAANRKGEAEIAVSSSHSGEPEISGTYVDYELNPREYELSLAQTMLRVHTRVADLYNNPMNQLEQQLRLTIEEMRERQEWELVNNRDFGLLHNTEYDQRISTHSGPPTPDDIDNLICMRRSTSHIFAHPKAISAFLRECNKRGLSPGSVTVEGKEHVAWRGIPILSCGKLEVSPEHTSTIMAIRAGEEKQGVVGLYQTGIPEEYEPSLNVRFMGITEKAIMQYLVSLYYSVATLVPDAVGLLEHCEVGRFE